MHSSTFPLSAAYVRSCFVMFNRSEFAVNVVLGFAHNVFDSWYNSAVMRRKFSKFPLSALRM